MLFNKREDSIRETDSCLLDAGADMTIYSAADNLTEIKGYYSQFNHFELNLSAVEEIDSSGIQLLLSLVKNAEKDGKHVVLSEISDPVIEIMDLLNIRSHFDWIKPE
ncbi:MAG: anti-sigma B factor antagonist [Polaribacter sp.]|jgi:anti-sigma B factor antagonist